MAPQMRKYFFGYFVKKQSFQEERHLVIASGNIESLHVTEYYDFIYINLFISLILK